MIWALLVLAVVVMAIFLACCEYRPTSGHDLSLADNHHFGAYRVRYPDGRLSQRFMLDVAQDYAKMFGGCVEFSESGDTIPRESIGCNGYCGDYYISPSCPRHGG